MMWVLNSSFKGIDVHIVTRRSEADLRAMVEHINNMPIAATVEPQLVFVVRYLDEDIGWTTLPVRAANEDEAREQVRGPVAGIYRLPAETV